MRRGIYIRIPANAYNFKSYIYNMPMEKFAIIIAGVSFTALLFTISLPVAAGVGTGYFLFMGLIGFEFHRIRSARKIYFHGSVAPGIKFLRKRPLFGIVDNYVFTVLEITNRELYTDSDKGKIIRSINKIIGSLSCGANIITKTHVYKDSNYYRTFIILKVIGKDYNKSMDILNGNLSNVQSLNQLKTENIDDKDEIYNLFYGTIKPHSRYFENNKMFCSYLDLMDMDYSSDFLYESAIERMGLIIEMNMEINPINNSEMLVKRLLSSRKAELNYTKSGHYASVLNKQVSSLEYLAGRERLFNVYTRFTVISRHPATLRSDTEIFTKNMESMGFKLKNFHYFNQSSFNPLKLEKQGIKYMMDPASLSEIFPCSFTPVPESSNNPIGINAITGKTLYFKLFKDSSYNVAITGETGSGKSYFAKKILKLGKSSRIYIIDPLEEYSGGKTIDLSNGEYMDFVLDSGKMSAIVIETLSEIMDIPQDEIQAIMIKLKSEVDNLPFSKLISELNLIRKGGTTSQLYVGGIAFKRPITSGSESIIFRFDHRNEKFRDSFFRLVFSQIVSKVEREQGEKIVIVDESHLFLRDIRNAELMDTLARNSRHFKTSLVTVTQNVDDYYMNKYAESLLRNSINYFIFRQREKISNKLFLDYEIDPTGLAGGNNSDYSECFYSTGTLIRKLKIMDIESRNDPS
jgi:Cdc6-like AAA superfamily ATPase